MRITGLNTKTNFGYEVQFLSWSEMLILLVYEFCSKVSAEARMLDSKVVRRVTAVCACWAALTLQRTLTPLASAAVCLFVCYDNMHTIDFLISRRMRVTCPCRAAAECLESNIDSGGQYHSINVTYWTFQAAAKWPAVAQHRLVFSLSPGL